MDSHLRVLMVEDSESDAALIVRQLEKANYNIEFKRVETADQMEGALAAPPWDFIFSDYTMPQFDAFGALKLLQESGQDIPFIVISGTIGEETAVEIMRSGAQDYIMKSKLSRLAPVVRREIAEARARKERRVTEKALQDSEARFRALIETARDVIFTMTPAGQFTSFNPAFEAATGWVPAEWVGKSLSDLIFADDVPKGIDRFRRVVDGEPDVLTELRVRTKDGGVVYAEFVATRYVQNGELMEILGIARVITERKEAERVLRNKEAQLSDAMTIARLGPWIHDLKNDLFTFNDHIYSIFRTTAKEAGGYTMSSADYVRKFVHPDDASMVSREIRKSLDAPEERRAYRLEHRIIYADGEVGYLEATIFVVNDENGRTVGTRGVNQDITERKRKEEQLRLSEERYRAMFESNPVPIILYDPASFAILAVNKATADLYGYTRQELTSMKITDIRPPEDVELLLEYFAKHPDSPGIPASGDIGRRMARSSWQKSPLRTFRMTAELSDWRWSSI